MLGANSFPDARWIVTDTFQGYQTKNDPSKVNNGANPNGQNTSSNNGDRISIRKEGYELFPAGAASFATTDITSLHTFRKRSGENILMRSYSTVLEYYEEGADEWTTLKTGLSDGAEFDYADYNINTDLQSYVYFGNAVDDFSRWSGAHGVLTTAVALGDSTIIVDTDEDFLIGSSTIIVCGTELSVNYFDSDNTTFHLTGTSSIACDNGSGVAETITTYADNPKGNIYLVDDNRLFISGIASTSQAIYFSEYGDATNFVGADLVTDSTATSPGIFNLGEGGGQVVGMAADEESIYFFKKSTIRKATLSDTLYTLGDLKPFDGKSQTIGATNNAGIFTGGNSVFFITPDNQMLSLGRVESVDYPQVNRISEIISPTVAEFNFDEASGIVFRNKAYFSAKSNTDVSQNNVVLVWDIQNKKWESPIVGWQVADFVVYDDGNNDALYFGDSNSPNVYKVTDEAIDGEFEVVSSWRSKQYSFDLPHAQKQMVDLYVEGYISQNTTLTVNLLLDEDGYTESFSHEVNGTDDYIIYDSTTFNTIGLTAFGTNRFGSQADVSGKKKFRVYLGKDFRPVPFYSAQIEFTSEGEAQDWEVLNYAFKTRPYTVETRRDLYQAFK